MYMYIEFASFYDFSIAFLKCLNSVVSIVFFVFLIIIMTCLLGIYQ